MPGGGVVIRDPPRGRLGQCLRNAVLVDTQDAGAVAVQNDFELGAGGLEELRDEAVCVSQFRDSDLQDKIDDSPWFELSPADWIKSRSRVHDYVIEVLTSY